MNKPKAIHFIKIVGIILGILLIISSIIVFLYMQESSKRIKETAIWLFTAGILLFFGAVSGRKLINLTNTSKMTIYSADLSTREWRIIFANMIRGAINSRYLAFRLFQRDLKSNYAESRFGWLWDFLQPLVNSLVFIILRAGNVINVGNIDIPYSVFIVIGFMLWDTFSESLLLPLGTIKKTKQLVTHVKIAPEAMILSNLFTILFNSIFKIAVIVLVAFFENAFSFVGFLKFLILYPGIILLGFSLSILLAPFNVFYKDIERVIRIILRPLMYITPVFYLELDIDFVTFFNKFNPIAMWINNLRSVITTNTFFSLENLFVVIPVSIVIFLFGWFVFHVSIPILSERV